MVCVAHQSAPGTHCRTQPQAAGLPGVLPALRGDQTAQEPDDQPHRAIFPRYLFIHLDKTSDNWARIRSTRGVSGLVRSEEVPKPVPSPLIDALRSNENSEQLQRVNKQSWNRGEVVEIEQAPFAGYSCIFQESRGSDRVSVLLNIVGKQTRATLLKNYLQAPQPA